MKKKPAEMWNLKGNEKNIVYIVSEMLKQEHRCEWMPSTFLRASYKAREKRIKRLIEIGII